MMPRARMFLPVLLLLCLTVASREVSGQCLLANPSFEVPGTAGFVFAGWYEVGAVGASANATHGAVAARVSGPNTGRWDVSAYWQRLDTAPGERWSAAVRVWHSATKPLTGQSQGILNIEWRGAAESLIGYESHTVAAASTPAASVQTVAVQSQPAPPGTVSTHLFLGVRQSPADPAPDVYFDQATFASSGPPTLDDLQWLDFPGGRTILWSGRRWRVKGPGVYEPGPNRFCDTASCIWTDAEDRLHLTVQDLGGSWASTEVALEEPLGYGDYVFTTRGRLDAWDPNVVLGLFLWQYARCYDPTNGWWNPDDEIDVEYSRWGDPANAVGQFVVQPFDFPGNRSRFDAAFADSERTSHALRWLADRVEFRSWRGGPQDEMPARSIHTWTYTGPQLPRPEQPRVHINLWHIDAAPSVSQELVLDQFRFVPAESLPTAVGEAGVAWQAGRATHLSFAVPNPFSPSTTIEYRMRRAGTAELVVHDVLGRRVRTLVRNSVPAGRHEFVWDGRDDGGNAVAAGVYLYRLRAGDATEVQRLVHLR